MSDYYFQMRHFQVEVESNNQRLDLVIRECADSVGDIKAMEMMAFLFGELQGLLSELNKAEMTLSESRFEDNNILLSFTPQV